jgi:hypothetical protein
MAGVPGNIAWVLANKQTVKGTPAAATAVGGAFKMPLTGGNIGPTRNMDNLDETDSSRDQGVATSQQTGVEGTPEFYVRDASIGFWLHKVLGADAVTGTTNFVHTITPANALPYITAWRNIGHALGAVPRLQGRLHRDLGRRGQPAHGIGWHQGLVHRLTAARTTPRQITVGQRPGLQLQRRDGVTLGGSVSALVRSFELTIENNLSLQQTDLVPYDVVEGTREVSLGFDLIFETLDEYNKFHYGGAAGTTQVPTIFTTSAQSSPSPRATTRSASTCRASPTRSSRSSRTRAATPSSSRSARSPSAQRRSSRPR